MFKAFNETKKSYATLDTLKKAVAKAEEKQPGIKQLNYYATVREDNRYVPTFILTTDEQLIDWALTLVDLGFCVTR